MSSPKFMVFKLKDLQIPIIMLIVALAVFSFFMFTSNDADATESFAPTTSYEDGMYIASIALRTEERRVGNECTPWCMVRAAQGN